MLGNGGGGGTPTGVASAHGHHGHHRCSTKPHSIKSQMETDRRIQLIERHRSGPLKGCVISALISKRITLSFKAQTPH